MAHGGLPSRAWTRLRRVGQRTRLRGQAAEMVGRPGDRAVVVLTDQACQDAVRGWLREFSEDRVTVLIVDGESDTGRGPQRDDRGVTSVEVADIDDVVARLLRLNAQDVIVVALSSPKLALLAGGHRRLFDHLFVHLRRGGAYVIDRTLEEVGTRDAPTQRAQGRFHRMLETAAGETGAARRSGKGGGGTRFVKAVLVTEDLVVVTRAGRCLLKLREHEIGDLLKVREPGIEVSVLEARPAGQLTLQIEEASYGPSRAEPWPERLEYPEMTLRHYEGDLVSAGGMRLFTGNTILPESFRWPQAGFLRNRRTPSVSPLFSQLGARPPELTLDGDYYYLDCLFPGHFGHLTTEVLSRLWGWERAKREMPELKVLFHTGRSSRADGSLERRLYTAYGISESDLTWSDRPVALRSVVGASPMWHNQEPHYAHPDIRETWARLSTGLLAGAAPAEHERIFVSRGASLSHRRGCRNQEDVERFFSERGYHVFYPEELSLTEQVALFAGARVVAGFGGSAMFNLMHTRRLEAVVVLSHNAYTARNEHLFASVLGAQLNYFWQPADTEPPKVGRSPESDSSSFAFDFATQGEDLARVLAGL